MFLQDFLDLARAKGVLAQEEFEGLQYHRFSDDLRRYLRGTVVLGDMLVFGYPKIARILSLEGGIPRHIKGPFYVEEKADGYNVRVVKVEDRILALTRGGFVCPFTTDRLPDLGDFEAFFRDHPHMVIAGEVVGPGNPYNEAYPPGVEDVAFLAFDLFPVGSWRPLSPLARYAILEKYAIPQVRSFGQFSPTPEGLDGLKALLRSLNREGVEGVVIKPQGGRRRFKYVTPFINIFDIEFSSHLLAELPGEFFIQRVIRLALSMAELGLEGGEELGRRLGAAFLRGFGSAVEEFRARKKVTWTFFLRMRSRDRVALLLRHLNRASRHVRVSLVRLEREGDYWRVVLEKRFLRSTGFLASALGGSFYFD